MRHGESGQGAAEYVGVLAVVVLVVAAMTTGGMGEAIADGAEHAVCRIVGGDCGEKTAQQPLMQGLARGEPASGPAVAGHDIALLPFPGAVSVSCGQGEANERACKADGAGVRAEGTITADRSSTTLDGDGCPQQTVSLDASFQVEQGQQLGGGDKNPDHGGPKATGRLGRYTGHANTYSISAAPDQIDRMEDGSRRIVNPLDPRTLRPGEGVQMSEAFYQGAGLSGDYRAMQASLGYDHGRRVSAGVTRVDDRTMRVYVGDEDVVRNALSLGIGGVSASFGRQLSDGKLKAVDLDIKTPEGWAAYQQFALSGRLPKPAAPGTSDPSSSLTHKASQSASLEAEFGNLKLGGLLTDSEGNYEQTTYADGRVEHNLAIRHDEVGLSVKVEKAKDGSETREYGLNLEDVDPGVYANFQRLNHGDTTPPAGGHVRMNFSSDELMGIRRQSLEHIAFEMQRRGVEPRPTPEDVAENLSRNHGTIRYGPDNAEMVGINAHDLDLAAARNPEEVLARLYRLADGDSHDFLTGPMTEFLLRTNTAHGDRPGSENGRLPGSVGGPSCPQPPAS